MLLVRGGERLKRFCTVTVFPAKSNVDVSTKFKLWFATSNGTLVSLSIEDE